MDDDDLIALFKVGERIHMEQLLHEGHVYMNASSYFATLDAGSPRSDSDEATGYAKNADGATFEMQVGAEWQPLGTVAGAIRIRDDALLAANLYCLHARTRRDYGTAFQLSQLGFGDSYVLFLDANEFFRRLEKTAGVAGHQLKYGLVEYVDRRTFSGPMGMFRKFSEYSAQREFRIAVLGGTGSALSLRLGDLSDIAIMRSTDERLRLDPKVPPNPALEPTAPPRS
jgi:hypothetical protein